MRQEKYMSTEVTAHRLKMLMRERNWGVKAFANRIPADKNSVKTWLAGQYYRDTIRWSRCASFWTSLRITSWDCLTGAEAADG